MVRIALTWLLLGLSTAMAGPRITLEVDGKPWLLGGDFSFRGNIPASTRELKFEIGTPPWSNNQAARRVRYQLEGVDADWREPAGEMVLVLRFYDAAKNQTAQTIFPSSGVSPGWKSLPSESQFTHRRESVIVPPGAVSCRVILSSAGPPSSVGILAVDDLEVSRATGERLIELQDPADPPAGWGRSGSHPSLATVLHLEREGLSQNVLAIVDDDPLAHAEWQISAAAAPAVQPGERLILEWNEMFTIGSANLFSVTYGPLPPGRYQFRAEELEVAGNLTSRVSCNLVVDVPYWRQPWFLLLVSLPAVGLIYAGIQAITRWRMRRQLEALQREQLLAQERLRIARDIHDDLGARLTHISLLSAMAESQADTEKDRAKFVEISGMTHELVDAMYETVWSINPRNDNLESLVCFLCQSTENLCKPAGIRCRFRDSPSLPGDLEVRSEVRHHVSLAVKEAVHNAVKHSSAAEIELEIDYAAPELRVSVSDNGGGFDPSDAPEGHGLKNLRRRMEAIGGVTEVVSRKGEGTQVRFSLRLEGIVTPPPSDPALPGSSRLTGRA